MEVSKQRNSSDRTANERRRPLRNVPRSRHPPLWLNIAALLALATAAIWTVLLRQDSPRSLNITQLSSDLQRRVCCQHVAVDHLLQLLTNTRCCQNMVVALAGTSGTGKTLMLSLISRSLSVNAAVRPVSSRWLFGGQDIVSDHALLQPLVPDLLTEAADGWLLLVLEDVADLLHETSELLRLAGDACEAAGVQLLVVMSVTTTLDHHSTPPSLTSQHVTTRRLVQAMPHVHVINLATMTRREVDTCVWQHVRWRGWSHVLQRHVDHVLDELVYEERDGWAVNGCKSAVARISVIAAANSSLHQVA